MNNTANTTAPQAKEEQVQDNPLGTSSELSSRNYLIFITDGLRLGVDAGCVVEILNNYNVTPLPMTPDYILGVFNMRGAIIPVLDIRLKLGKPASDQNLLVVIDYEGTQVGVLVDAVDQMIEIPDSSIMAMPSTSPQRLVSGMCTLPDESGTLLILDCEQLLGHEH